MGANLTVGATSPPPSVTDVDGEPSSPSSGIDEGHPHTSQCIPCINKDLLIDRLWRRLTDVETCQAATEIELHWARGTLAAAIEREFDERQHADQTMSAVANALG